MIDNNIQTKNDIESFLSIEIQPATSSATISNNLSTENAKLLFHWFIDKNIIKDIDPNFFSNNNTIRAIFQIIKNYSLKFKTIPNYELLINSIDNFNNSIDSKTKINKNEFTELWKYKSSYENICMSSGEKYIMEIYQKYYPIFIYNQDVAKNVDLTRNLKSTTDLAKINEYLKNNNINIPLIDENTILIDEYGKVDYSNFSNKEIQEYSFTLSNTPINEETSNIIKNTFTDLDLKMNYVKKQYIFYPLIKENQLGIIFGKSGEGKSIFAMEIANFIAKGKSDWEYFEVQTSPQKVLYINFELSVESIASRYKFGKFDDNLIIRNIDTYQYNSLLGFGIKSEIRIRRALDYIEQLAKYENSKIIFIDNLSNIADNVEQASDADRFISDLYGRMKAKGLTIIFLGHTPKISNSTRISINQLKGSSSLSKTFEIIIGFQRSIIDKNLSYIKQIKTRDVEYVFDELNVAKFRFDSNGKYGWCLNYDGNEIEDNLIDDRKNNPGRPVKYDNVIKLDILDDVNNNKLTPKEIQLKYSISRPTYYNILKEYDTNKNNLKNEYDIFMEEKDKHIFDVLENKTNK